MTVSEAANWFFLGAALVVPAFFGAAIATAAFAVTRRWSLALKVARYTTLAAPSVIAVMVVSAAALVARAAATGSEDRVVLLARGIAETMNCAAAGALAMLVSGPIWFIASRRLRRGSEVNPPM